MPYYSDDIGNWLEPLGVLSLVVEGILLVLGAVMFTRVVRKALTRVP
ncbi:hypothetical protein [Saccharopolyspora pogona]|nr:hypothetical protein [Saccharopolyspora pogona]